MGFSTLDYAVLAAYLIGITIFGARFRTHSRSTSDYFIGTRTTAWWVIGLSIVATETSTLTLIGVPAIAFATYARPEQGGNLTYLQVVLGYLVGRVIVAWLFIPAYFQGELLTAYELLHRRFGTLLPRNADQQEQAGEPVDPADARPGDLFCYGDHIAIYLGDNRIVHAAESHGKVVEEEQPAELSKRLRAVRRVFDGDD